MNNERLLPVVLPQPTGLMETPFGSELSMWRILSNFAKVIKVIEEHQGVTSLIIQFRSYGLDYVMWREKQLKEYHRRKEVIEVLHGIAHDVVYQSACGRLSK